MDRVATAVMDTSTGSAAAARDRREIFMVITKGWFTPAVKTAARHQRDDTRLILCRPYHACVRSDMAAANQAWTAAVRAAHRAHRSKLERTCAHHCRASLASRCKESMESLPAASRNQCVSSLHHPVSGDTSGSTADAAKAAALVAFTAGVSGRDMAWEA